MFPPGLSRLFFSLRTWDGKLMSKIAILTGASSGLGVEFYKEMQNYTIMKEVRFLHTLTSKAF